MAVLANVLWPLAAAALLASAVALGRGRKREWRPLTVAAIVLLIAECALEGAWVAVAWNVLGFIAVKTGMVEGSVALRIIPPKKRELERAAETAGDAVPLREAS